MSLTALQLRFLAARLLTATDKEAAEQIEIPPQTVKNWKQESAEFLARYEGVFEDGIVLAKEYTKKLLGKAARRLDEALDATKTVGAELKVEYFSKTKERQYVAITEPDHNARIQAAKLLFQTHGLLTTKVDIEIRVRQMAEALGLDPQAAVEEAKRIVAGASTGSKGT